MQLNGRVAGCDTLLTPPPKSATYYLNVPLTVALNLLKTLSSIDPDSVSRPPQKLIKRRNKEEEQRDKKTEYGCH